MYLWKYRASAAWLAAHESELEQTFAGNVVLIDQPGRARLLVQVTCQTRGEMLRLVRRFGGAGERLPRDWARKYLRAASRKPLRIGRRLMVLPEPDAAEPKALVIPAAGAFGTGEHATTAMCLRFLEETTRNMPEGWRLLDAGTGTGILALAARRLGAREVLGLDHDPRATAHARQNARLNKIRRAEFVSLDLLGWKPPRRYEVITANLFSELLIAALPIFRRALLPGGTLIFSGILREQAAEVIEALRRKRFRVERPRRRGKWVALRCAL